MASRQRKEKQCNICGYPARIEYKETNKETGVIETRTHRVECLGHDVHPSQWNGHSDFAKFEQLKLLQEAA